MNPNERAIVFGFALFIGLSISKFMGNDPLTLKSFLSPLVGAIAGGLVIYLISRWRKKKK